MSDHSSEHEGPLCAMCTTGSNPAISYCKTCRLFLCLECDYAHKAMVCFQLHEIVPKTTSEKQPSEVALLESKINRLMFEGRDKLDTLKKQLSDINGHLESLGKYRLFMIGCVNEMHQAFQQHIKQQRDSIINNLEENLYATQLDLLDTKRDVETSIKNFMVQLADFNALKEPKGRFVSAIGRNSAVNKEDTEGASHFSSTSSSSRSMELVPADINNNPTLNRLLMNRSVTVNSMKILKIFGQKGIGSGDFNSPHGFCIGFNEDIVVADTYNHCIQVFDKFGTYKYQFGVSGRVDGRLWHPRKIAVLPIRRQFVVCDRGFERSRMQIFTEEGRYVKKIYIKYIDIVSGIAITPNEDIVVVDSVTPTVFIIGQDDYMRSIDCREYIEESSDIAVSGGEIFICDFKGHCVAVIDYDGQLLRKFGCRETTNFPNGIDISDFGDVLVGDSHGNFFHVTVYTKSGEFVGEYRCPFLTVSRCCCLKINSKGQLITVDKNYHHVIIFETLFLPNRGLKALSY